MHKAYIEININSELKNPLKEQINIYWIKCKYSSEKYLQYIKFRTT